MSAEDCIVFVWTITSIIIIVSIYFKRPLNGLHSDNDKRILFILSIVFRTEKLDNLGGNHFSQDCFIKELELN